MEENMIKEFLNKYKRTYLRSRVNDLGKSFESLRFEYVVEYFRIIKVVNFISSYYTAHTHFKNYSSGETYTPEEYYEHKKKEAMSLIDFRLKVKNLEEIVER
jgi:hypothetical protein